MLTDIGTGVSGLATSTKTERFTISKSYFKLTEAGQGLSSYSMSIVFLYRTKVPSYHFYFWLFCPAYASSWKLHS